MRRYIELAYQVLAAFYCISPFISKIIADFQNFRFHNRKVFNEQYHHQVKIFYDKHNTP